MNTTSIEQTNTPANPNQTIATSTQGSTLADILERVLDKGIVIADDSSVSIDSSELLHIRIRLLIASVDKVGQMTINWREKNDYLGIKANNVIDENQKKPEELHNLAAQMRSIKAAAMSETELGATPKLAVKQLQFSNKETPADE